MRGEYAARTMLLLAEEVLVERTNVARLFVLDGDVTIGRESTRRDGDLAENALERLVEDVGQSSERQREG